MIPECYRSTYGIPVPDHFFKAFYDILSYFKNQERMPVVPASSLLLATQQLLPRLCIWRRKLSETLRVRRSP